MKESWKQKKALVNITLTKYERPNIFWLKNVFFFLKEFFVKDV